MEKDNVETKSETSETNDDSFNSKNESYNTESSNTVDSPKNETQAEPDNIDTGGASTPVKEQTVKYSEHESPEGIDKKSPENANEIFRTPKKKVVQTRNPTTPSDKDENNSSLGISNKCHIHKTPEKGTMRNGNNEDESQANLEGGIEEEMISEVEQAKQLLVESENYLKTLERTPVKQMVSQSPQNLSKYSPGTPGRHKRVNLITLDSPKAKKFKAEF